MGVASPLLARMAKCGLYNCHLLSLCVQRACHVQRAYQWLRPPLYFEVIWPRAIFSSCKQEQASFRTWPPMSCTLKSCSKARIRDRTSRVLRSFKAPVRDSVAWSQKTRKRSRHHGFHEEIGFKHDSSIRHSGIRKIVTHMRIACNASYYKAHSARLCQPHQPHR